jgi:HEAT repeat protein
MRLTRLAPALLMVLLGLRGAPALAVDPPVAPSDEQALKAAGLKADGPTLLDFFRKRVAGKADAEQVATLVKALAEKDAVIRDKATAELVGLGELAVPALRQFANELENADAAALAHKCLQNIEGPTGAALSAAAVRALAGLKPAGTVEMLIAYLPIADDDQVLDEVTATLVAVAVKEGTPNAALVKALTDEAPARRAVAAEVLAQVGGADQRGAVRKLLTDPKPTVRLRAALALAQAQDAAAVPVLIGLLADAPPQQARQIEDYLMGVAGEWSIAVPQGGDAVSRKLRSELWAAWWKAAEGSALVDELKTRTPSDETRAKVLALIAKLDDKDSAIRDKAVADLVALGAEAAPLLRQAAGERDAKADAAHKCLSQLDPDVAPPVPTVAVRLLAMRRPAGGAEAILAFLPSAEDDVIAGELRTALIALAMTDGKVDPAVARALEDKLPVRRAAAAEALAFGGGAAQRDAVRKLLKDNDPSVKLRTAIALTSAQDKATVPELIALLTDLPANLSLQAEDHLRILAGEGAPALTEGDDAAARKKARTAWEAWWKKSGDKLQLARLDNRQQLLGYTVVTEMWDQTRRSGRIVELDRRGKVRWEISGANLLQGPVSAQVLPNDRVLIAEYNVGRVTERDLKGKILWERQLQQAKSAQRLSNGNMFLVGQGQIIEIDKAGKEVLNINRTNFWDIVSATRQRNGEIVYVTQQGQVTRMDKEGKKEIKHFQTNAGGGIYNLGHIDILANDHVIVPAYSFNKVTEYDGNGKEVWTANVTMPVSAKRLPNGNTLVASFNPPKVIELDRAGKVVWEAKETFRQPVRADRR